MASLMNRQYWCTDRTRPETFEQHMIQQMFDELPLKCFSSRGDRYSISAGCSQNTEHLLMSSPVRLKSREFPSFVAFLCFCRVLDAMQQENC
jgi:hypothetical protein